MYINKRNGSAPSGVSVILNVSCLIVLAAVSDK